ncbi:MAG: hypothetical protein IMW89_16690 [Ktedonobacteraceae bacterium]|nr:hypothetical protein [Ktedonobacteraceae bacterium]
MASTSATNWQGRAFVGPGLRPFKLYVTIFGVLALTALALAIAIRQGVSVIGSTIVALLFILGFAYYLRLIAPVPFTLTLEQQAVVKRDRNGQVIEVRWEELTRVKEEFFPNGKRISVTAYRKVTQPGQKAKVWAIYRDDVDNLDELAEALRQAIPPTCEWQSETVHD